MKYIYGLDLSMSCTGYCVMDLEGNIVKSGIVKTRQKDTHGVRLKTQYDVFLALLEEFKPIIVGIEKGFTNHNKSTQIIFRVHGVADMTFSDYEQIRINNSTLKKDFTGNGKASKELMMSEVRKRYGLEVTNDEADAIAVAEMTRKEYLKRVK